MCLEIDENRHQDFWANIWRFGYANLPIKSVLTLRFGSLIFSFLPFRPLISFVRIGFLSFPCVSAPGVVDRVPLSGHLTLCEPCVLVACQHGGSCSLFYATSACTRLFSAVGRGTLASQLRFVRCELTFIVVNTSALSRRLTRQMLYVTYLER